MNKLALAIHGGAGTILRSAMTPEREQAYKTALEHALRSGYHLLEAGKTAVEAVEASVTALEDSPLFNAGKGSVFTAEGTHEMDAAIMDGKDLSAGAVALISKLRNPIKLARLVMEQSPHVFLAGKGAENFAEQKGCDFVEADYFFDQFRYDQWTAVKGSTTVQLDHTVRKEDKFGTVGAVALDAQGNLAAATSTGGMTNKQFGRVGDSPMIGAGNYANNQTCAVSCTGSGEYFIRAVVAYDVSALMEFGGKTLEEACEEVIHRRLPRIKGDGGLIAVSASGEISMPFNTAGMYRACIDSAGNFEVAIYKD